MTLAHPGQSVWNACVADGSAMQEPTQAIPAPKGVEHMNDQTKGREQGPGTDRSPSGAREANDPGRTRFGTNAGSGSNEPKHGERKEQHPDWKSRQGGDETGQPPKQGDDD